ncbi:MAG: hypothetical protein AAGF49_16360 [Pseudomonadota bacterium]
MRNLVAVAFIIATGGLLWILWDIGWRALTSLPSKDEIQAASAEVADVVVARAPSAPPEPTEPDAGDETAPDRPRSTVRFVEEDGIVGVRIDGPLERAPSVAKLSPPPPPPGETPDEYRLVVIEGADLINARSHKIDLAHITAPAADATCQRADGSAWPCGMRARTALRRLIRRRAIECLDVKPVDLAAPVRTSACKVANVDLSQWLIENGWAEPAETAPDLWRDLHETAKSEALGLYATDPR